MDFPYNPDSYNSSQDAEHRFLQDISRDKYSSELNYEHLIDEFRNQVEDNKLVISDNNDLKNIEFLNDFQIKELIIEDCINVIPKLKTLKIKKITFSNCGIQNLHDIWLPSLKFLSLSWDFQNGKDYFDFSSLRQFSKLKELVIEHTEAFELKQIPQYITKLEVYESYITDMEELMNFTKLTNFTYTFLFEYIEDIQQIDVSLLAEMVQLTYLNLQNCILDQVDPLKTLVNLKELNLAGNKNLNIFPLQFLKQLTVLSIEQCLLIDITYLKPLVNLKELHIFDNNIVYLEPLKELQQIEYLDTRSNLILDVSVLNNHPNFCSYFFEDQKQPDKQQIAFANKLRDINTQITSIRNMNKIRYDLKSYKIFQHWQVDKCLQRSMRNYIQFISQVTSLFQQLSSLQNFE
ncbi:Conserved_hypothetical protein [Hexamita inflata]|uniref:Leucine rich repeat protein n=1 Tax=Hexamita inflata TaxID=28002 RepID=A0AA86UCW7_9EUKA|nr:Conserved hypothetical protein [Hexamita inflata]